MLRLIAEEGVRMNEDDKAGEFEAQHEDIQRSIAELVGKIRRRAASDALRRVDQAFAVFIESIGMEPYAVKFDEHRSVGTLLEQAREIILREATQAEDNTVLATFIRRISESMKNTHSDLESALIETTGHNGHGK